MLSMDRLAGRVRDYPYSFLYTLSLFFPGFPAAMATFVYDSKVVLADVGMFHGQLFSYWSHFVLLAPIALFEKKRALRLYGLLCMMFLVFFPFIFAHRGLNQRSFAQGIVFSSMFVGLLSHYVFGGIKKLSLGWLRWTATGAMVLFCAVSGVRLMMVWKHEIGQFIRTQSATSASVEQFMEEFKNVSVSNPARQMYLMTNSIPQTASFIGNPIEDCYYFYYLATKFKALPVELYRHVFRELETGRPLDEERCRNYFIKVGGAAFGFFNDREKLSKVLQENSDISVDDVIVLTWQGGLKQAKLAW